MGIGKRLQELTADLKSSEDVPVSAGADPLPTPMAGPGNELETRFPPALPGMHSSRTGPGQMLAFRGQMLAVETELSKLRTRLVEYEGSLPTRKLDPNNIVPSRWANRHPASYTSPKFMSLRADIEHAGGNVQPILVRPLEGQNGIYEIVFGHRRHQACKDLGLPVLSAIWTEPLTDGELFAAMDRENRERADLSPYEQGLMYHKALEESLYPSQRRLAESLGVSHTWVRKALVVAELPQTIIECFRNPLEIQHRHAEQIAAALEANRKGVLKRAEKIRGQNLSASDVVTQLAETAPNQDHNAQSEIRLGAKLVGYWTRDKSGAFIIKLAGDTVPAERVQLVIDAVTRSLS